METTIYSFNAKDIRLQFVKISYENDPNLFFEIRCNRKLIERFPRSYIRLARFTLSNIISKIIIDQISPQCQM